MPSALDRIDFGPPPDAGAIRSFGLALLVHAALIAALTWGVNWKRSNPSVAFEAELWSSVPQEAAPKLVEPPPAPPPEPAPKVQEVAAPEPKVDIALEQEKKRKLLEQQKLRNAAEAKAEALAEKERKLKQELTKVKAAEDAKKLEAKKQAAKEQETAAALEEQRKQNIARTMGLAGAAGGETAKGTALTSSGPSASYKAKLAALFKRNITFSNADSIQGNPRAVVQVKVSSSGLIMSSRLSKSSGNAAWDEAVLRAVEKTERIPLDENGKVVTDFPVDFGPKD
jgi:colicin import membrane protein